MSVHQRYEFPPKTFALSGSASIFLNSSSACCATSGGTLANVSIKLIEEGATEVYAAVTHGVLTEGAIERLEKSPIKRLLITDTVEHQPVQFTAKIEVVSVAAIFGEAIKRIHNRESISEMFKDI